jgi:hypothetical protein
LPGDLVKAGIAAFPDSLKTPNERFTEREDELRKALVSIDKMIGLANAKKDLKQNIALATCLAWLEFRELPGFRDGRTRLAAWFDAFAKRPSLRATPLSGETVD